MTHDETPRQHETASKRGMASKVGRTSYRVANVLMPLGEITGLGKLAARSLGHTARRVARLREGIRQEKQTQLTFEEAVAASGRTEAQLGRKFLHLKRLWWVATLAGALITPLLLVMIVLAAHTLPGVTLIRALTFVLIFAAITAIAATRVVISQFRRWQLATRRLTPEDRGTFADFRRETDWLAQCLTPF
ncbi:conjugal transfer protein TraX [Rouxiella badensis]|jgi:hypothetical protein|uniref:conjugal transfer protein TraX n=1 Tax=Rouxiella badensis TaxID=1646377 RepID=UPI001787AA31|nr:conjugal transfer protein TraX [Rouxiella badensis]QOI58014.1 conjugal transfer protein TraX [Rouxiella badensis subsp. acadiensis]